MLKHENFFFYFWDLKSNIIVMHFTPIQYYDYFSVPRTPYNVERNDNDVSKPVGRHFNLPRPKQHMRLRPFPTPRRFGEPKNSRT